jgi:DNA invertase Pin-like site-specific DNA recombinase
VYQRVSKLANAQDRKEIERARSIEEQNKANQAECDQHGWTITERYEDPGLSASRFATKARPEYRRLLADIKAGKLDVVVLWESSRGDRELAGWAQFLNACRESQTRIYITTHSRLYDVANGRDWRNLAEDGVDSGYESEKTSMRVRRTVAAKMQAGEPFGHCPYGYEREYHPRTRELIEQRPSTEPANPADEGGMTKADVIRYIFRSIDKGTPLSEIRRWLNEQGIPAPEGGEWGRSVIQRIAGNPVYIGKRRWRHHDGLLDGKWAPIVNEETFWTVQRILSDPKRKTTRPGGVRHMLSYLATCGECGQELTAAGPDKKNHTAVYRCFSGCVHIRADWLDDYISMSVIERLSRSDAYPLTADSDKEAVSARAESAELRARLDEHADLAAEGRISPISFARIEQKLLAKIAEADRRVALAAVPPVFRDIAGGSYEQIEKKWEGLPITARKELCHVLFEQISVTTRTRFRRPKRHRGRFEVRMTVDGREKFIGSYESMAEAIEVRNAKFAELGIPVTDDNAETPSWHGFDPERVRIKWSEEPHAAAGISSA